MTRVGDDGVWPDAAVSCPAGRISTVTDAEDVSYVSSPYLPNILRQGGRKTTSNKNRAHEAGEGGHGIADTLDETLVLRFVPSLNALCSACPCVAVVMILCRRL